MTAHTLVTLFSGGRLCDIGYHAAGFKSILAVEFDEAICRASEVNFTDNAMRCADVRSVDYRPFAGADGLHVSPPCQDFSVANSNGGETEMARELGAAVSRAIKEIRPKIFTLEEVRAYARSDSYKGIAATLRECGYIYEEFVRNSADSGVPQTRERLIVRAVRKDVSKYLPEFTATHGNSKSVSRGMMDIFSDKMLLPWNGWYGAVADLLHLCPETTLARWQMSV